MAGLGMVSTPSGQGRQLAVMLLQGLSEPGCLSDDCGSGTRGPIAGRTPGAPGPGSAPAASHFPASVYS